MSALWPNGKKSPGDVWHEYGPRRPIWTPNGYTTSFHSGIDIGPWNGAHSTWLLAPDDGIVSHAGYDSIFGNRVVVTTWYGNDKVEFWLCHGRPRSMQVKVGQKVRQRERIQLMGETGKASGVHIHYEIHVNGVRVDPRDFYARPTSGGSTSKPAAAPTTSDEEEDDTMYIANVKNGNFYLVIGKEAHALGAGSDARKSGIPIINYVDDWAVKQLKTVVSGITH